MRCGSAMWAVSHSDSGTLTPPDSTSPRRFLDYSCHNNY